MLGGRDLQAGGTWMALSTTGRAAFLTNFRQARPALLAGYHRWHAEDRCHAEA